MSISVVIPTHNRSESLLRALRSVYKQTVLPNEIVVVDDGSNPPVDKSVFDECPEQIYWKLLRNVTPKGANNSRNKGIESASGEWIAFLDDDDEFFSSKIEVITDFINQRDDLIDVVYHPAKIYMINEGVSYVSKPKQFTAKDDVFRQLLINNYIGGTPMVVVKKSTLIEVGLFDEELPAQQDYELWLRMAKNESKFCLVNKPLTKYYHKTKGGSITNLSDNSESAYSIIEKKYEQDYKLLSENEYKIYRMRKKNRLIHKSFLNKKYFKSIYLNFEAFIEFKKVVYLITAFASFFGSNFIFCLRARLNKLFSGNHLNILN